VHAPIARHGILPPSGELFGEAGGRFLEGLELRDAPRRRLDSLLSLIADLDREVELATREIEARARGDERVRVLTQIRGVGRYTAMLVIAEVVSRFANAHKLCAWAGLPPTIRSSDGRARLGRISRQGSRVLAVARNPHPLLLRPARRRDPLPRARVLGGGGRSGELGGCHDLLSDG
jgi:transposase